MTMWPKHTWPGKRVVNHKMIRNGQVVYEMSRAMGERVRAIHVPIPPSYTRNATARELWLARKQLARMA